LRANLGHIGNNINNHMINWYIYTYKEMPDLSQQAVFILAQVLAVLIGVVAFGAVIYGLVKFHTREK
jgi:hypothetical protein